MSSDETQLTQAPSGPDTDEGGPAVDDAQIEERGLSLLRDRRRLIAGVLAFVLLLLAVYVVVPKVVGLDDALGRIDDGEAAWIIAAILANVAAFGAYVMLFRGILGSDTTPEVRRRLGVTASYEITMASLAATRIFSAAGVGGLVVTYWALHKAGMSRRRAACRMVAFLAVLYSIYLITVVLFGILLRTGVLPGEAPLWGTVIPAAIAGAVLILLGLVARLPDDVERRLAKVTRGYRRAKIGRQLAKVPATLAMGIRTAIGYIRYPRRGALAVSGAIGFWAANIAILWCSFEAFGASVPFAVLVQGFFLGMAANLIPSPAGGVGSVDAGMIGAFLLFGVDSEFVFPAVLTYRVIAFWLPIPPGIVAFFQLRRTVAHWREEDEGVDPPDTIQSEVMAARPS